MSTAELQDNAEYMGHPIAPEYGNNPKSGKREIRLYMEIADGPLAGRRVKYTANTKDPRSTAYAKRDLMAAGWKGKDIGTFVADVTANAQTKISFTVRLARVTRDDGSVNEWWTVGSIGQGAIPLAKATPDDDRTVNGWFAEAEEIGGGQGSTSSTGGQPANNTAHPNAPGNSRVPF